MRSKAAVACPGRLSKGLRSGIARMSSASWEACQKNRYGLIVVPRMATIIIQKLPSAENDGTKRPQSISFQETCATITVPK